MGAANAGEHGDDVGVADVERVAELAVASANAREPAFRSGDRNRLAAPLTVDTGGEIQDDRLRIRGQGIEALAAQPGRKLPPVGLIGAPGVFRAGVAGVVAGLGAKGVELGRGARLERQRRRRPLFRFCFLSCRFDCVVPTGRGGREGLFWLVLVRHGWGSESCR